MAWRGGIFLPLMKHTLLIHEHSFLSDTPRNLNRTLPSYEFKARPLIRLLCYRKDWILECYSQCIMLNRKMQVLHNHYIGKRDGQGRRTLKEQGYRFPSFIVNPFCSFKNLLLPFKQCSTISHYSGSGSSLLVACNKLCGKGVFSYPW